MRKTLLTLCCGLFVLALTASCGKKEESTEGNKEEDPQMRLENTETGASEVAG
jgi:hypothetical protein